MNFNFFNQFTCCSTKVSPEIAGAWSHIELGAANYGKQSEASTFESQYHVLFETIDQLIIEKGLRGRFYLNDLTKEDVDYTIIVLENYLKKNYPEHQIEVCPLVGNFFKISLPKVDSIHLKNPEYTFFTTLDHWWYQRKLKYFAEQSREGLILTTYYMWPMRHRVKALGVGYEVVDNNFAPYIRADGTAVETSGPVLKLLIQSKEKIFQAGESESFVLEDKGNHTGTLYRKNKRFDLLDAQAFVRVNDQSDDELEESKEEGGYRFY